MLFEDGSRYSYLEADLLVRRSSRLRIERWIVVVDVVESPVDAPGRHLDIFILDLTRDIA
jgi:hypothetical protein